MKHISLIILITIAFTTQSQTLTKVDQLGRQTLYKNDHDFLLYNCAIKSDSVYKIFFDKNYIVIEDLKRIRLSQSPITIPVESQKIANTELSRINMEFIEVVKMSATKYRLVFKYWQNNDLNAPHYYCLEVTSEHDPNITTEFYQSAKKVSSSYCGDTY